MTNEAPDRIFATMDAITPKCGHYINGRWSSTKFDQFKTEYVRADLPRPVKVKSTEGDAKRAILAKATLHFEDVADALAKGTDRERLSSAVLREVVVSLRKMSEEI